METEILDVSDRLLAAVMNGIYQGSLITVLVGLGFRVFPRINAATRHAAWLCTLVLLVFLVVAHCFFHSLPLASQPERIARTATPEQEVGAPSAVAAVTTDGMPTGTRSEWPGYLPAGPEQLFTGAGDLPAPTGDPPGGTVAMPGCENSVILRSFPVPSGESPDGTGGSPVLPMVTRYSGPSTAVEPLREPTASNRSAWFYSAIERLANPVSLTLGIESRAARISGLILLSACAMLSAARLFMLLLRLNQIRKLKQQSFPASEAHSELFRGLVARLGVGRKVALKTLPASPSSFVLGFIHPVILLPTEPMEIAEAEQILRHELAHVRRRDDWANLLQHCILAAFPFHPAVWWISRRLSLEREIACDDYVLQSSARPHAYALLLANLAARMQRCPPLLAPGASNNKTQLQQRIDMILNTRRNTSPRLVATWLAFMASTAALLAVIAICLAPRIVLAQSATAPAAANAQGSLIDDPRTPALASAAVSFSPEAGAAASSDAALPATPKPAAIGSGPKLKTGHSWAITGQPAPPTPAVLAAPSVPGAPAPLVAQSVPLMPPGSFSLSAAPAPEPRPGRTPRAVRAESADSTLEERLERLEKMVESLMARGYAPQYPYRLKPSPDTVAPMNRKEMAELEAKLKADIGRKHELNEREIEKIKEHAKRETARAADQVKRSAVDAEKIARAEQKRQSRRGFKEGPQKQLDELRKRIEMLEREREQLEHQIEEIERSQEQLQEEQNENQENDTQSDASESNSDSKENTRQ